MKVYKKRKYWCVRKDAQLHKFMSKTEAESFAGSSSEPDWKLHIPEELPLPEVREYDSMEEAIAEED